MRERVKKLLFDLARRGYHRYPVLSIPLFAVTVAVIWLALLAAPIARAWREFQRRRKSRRPFDRGIVGLTFLDRLIESGKAPRGPLRKALILALSSAGHYCLSSGKLRSARQCLELVIRLADGNSWEVMYHYRSLGATCFLHGDLPDAHRAFAAAAQVRRVLLACGRVSPRVRLLGGSWFVAFGHIAMLDFYFKHRELGNAPRAAKIAIVEGWGKPPNKVLCQQFFKRGIDAAIDGARLARYYDRNKAPEETRWKRLTHEDQRMLVDDFWEYEFPDGVVLTYTHGAAKIQQEWEAQRRPPMMTLDDGQRAAAAILLSQLRIPETAWFACMHVREAGFHKKWNSKYPSARDSKLDDYYLAIKEITDRGGWVIRMGDRTMMPLPEMEQVVDYAHSAFKCEVGDIVLPASARFLLGTNSGFATIPGIYGVPNVLTNWVPVALPLWFGQDLMIPKLFRDRREQRYVSFKEMFSTRLGAIQNTFDFPEHIEIVANTPEEIREVVAEMLDRLEGKRSYTQEDIALQARYFELAIECGSYRGSGIGQAFLARHAHLLAPARYAEPLVGQSSPRIDQYQTDQRTVIGEL